MAFFVVSKSCSHRIHAVYGMPAAVKEVAEGFAHCAVFADSLHNGRGKAAPEGHIVCKGNAVNHHVRLFQKLHGFFYFGQTKHFAKGRCVQRIGYMDGFAPAAQPPGQFGGNGVGLGFNAVSHAAACGYHRNLGERCKLHAPGRFHHGAAACNGHCFLARKQGTEAVRTGSAHFAEHLHILFRIAGNHQHVGNVQRLGQSVFQIVQTKEAAGEVSGAGQHLVGFGRQLHAGCVQREKPLILQVGGNGAHFPFGKPQSACQRAAAYGLHVVNAGQYLSVAADLFHLLGSQAFHQRKKLAVVQCGSSPLMARGQSTPRWAKFDPLNSIPYFSQKVKAKKGHSVCANSIKM